MRDPDWLRCRDGRCRLLRGCGDAIVPQLAAEFVTAFLECVPEGMR